MAEALLLFKIAADKRKIKEKNTETTLREVFIVKSFMEWAGVPLFQLHTVQQRSGGSVLTNMDCYY